jgi:hypothetical protein
MANLVSGSGGGAKLSFAKPMAWKRQTISQNKSAMQVLPYRRDEAARRRRAAGAFTIALSRFQIGGRFLAALAVGLELV